MVGKTLAPKPYVRKVGEDLESGIKRDEFSDWIPGEFRKQDNPLQEGPSKFHLKNVHDSFKKILDSERLEGKRPFYEIVLGTNYFKNVLEAPGYLFEDRGMSTYISKVRISAITDEEKLAALSVVGCQLLEMEPFLHRICLDLCGTTSRTVNSWSGKKERIGTIKECANAIRNMLSDSYHIKISAEKSLERYTRFVLSYGFSTGCLTTDDAHEIIKKVEESKSEDPYIRMRTILYEISEDKLKHLTGQGVGVRCSYP